MRNAVVVLVLASALAACGGGDDAPAPAPTATARSTGAPVATATAPTPAPASAGSGMSVDDVLQLKAIGFTDEQILAEVANTKTVLALSAEDAQRFVEAGFAAPTIAKLRESPAAAPGAAPHTPAPAATASGMSVDDIVQLKEIGFTDEQILGEVASTKTVLVLSAADVARFEKAGFSAATIAALKNPATGGGAAATGDVASVVAMVKKGQSVEQILDAISGQRFEWTAARSEELAALGVPLPVILAMQGDPMTSSDAQSVAAARVTPAVWQKLVAALGVAPEELGPAEALALVRAGVPADVVTRLRDPAATPASGGGPGATPPAPTKRVAVEVLQPTRPGVLEHVGRRFEIHYPPAWKIVRALDDGGISYYFTPGEETHPHRMKVSLQIGVMPVPAQSTLVSREPVDLLKHMVPMIRQWEPGLTPEGDVREARLGGLAAAVQTFRGTLKQQPGRFRIDLWLAPQEDEQYYAAAIAPDGGYDAHAADFDKILAESRFGRVSRPRLERSLEARHIVEKFDRSTVSVVALKDGRPHSTGTGWIISKSGYVMTNWHVVFDQEAGKAYDGYYVEWDPTFKIRRKDAQLIRYKVQPSGFQHEWGVDIALLKIEAGDYEPFEMSPLRDVKPGDDVVTLGFPSRGLLTTAQALTVTRGVVTRFNRDALGNVVSIYTDAAITHGSSGGPCVSLVTGAVLGLNTFGQPIRGAGAATDDLVNYFGVVPVDAVLKEFPLVAELGRDHQAGGLTFMDCYELARLYQDRGAATDAAILAARAKELKPDDPDARFAYANSLAQDAFIKLSEGTPEVFQKAYADAIASYEAVLQADPEHSDALTMLANLKMQEAKFEEAAGYADRAMKSDPDDWEYANTRAQVAIAQEKYDEALDYAQKAKKLAKDVLPDPSLTAGWAYYGKKDYEKGRAEFEHASRIHRYNLVARIGVGLSWEYQDQTDRALAEYDDVALDFPENAAVEQRIGETLYKGKQVKKSIDRLFQAVNWYENAGEVPPDTTFDMLVKALVADGNDQAALRMSAKWLSHSGLVSSAVPVHLQANQIATKLGIPSLGHAHLRVAHAITEDAQVKQQIEQQQLVPLALTDIENMMTLQYHPSVAQVLIVVSPLAFAIQSEEDVRKLQQQGFPDQLIRAMLESQNRNGGGGAGVAGGGAQPGGQPGGGGAGQALLGTWATSGEQNGQQTTIVLQFDAGGRFAMQTQVNGQVQGNAAGTWQAEGSTVTTAIDGGGRQAYQYAVSGNQLTLQSNAGSMTFERQGGGAPPGSQPGAQPGGQPGAFPGGQPGTGPGPQPGGGAIGTSALLGTWLAEFENSGARYAILTLYAENGRFVSKNFMNGEAQGTVAGSWQADGRTLTTVLDEGGRRDTYTYTVSRDQLVVDVQGGGRLTFQRQADQTPGAQPGAQPGPQPGATPPASTTRIVGDWITNMQDQGVRYAIVISLAANGQFVTNTYMDGEAIDTLRGSYAVDSRNITTVDEFGDREVVPYSLSGNTLTLDFPELGRMQFQRRQ